MKSLVLLLCFAQLWGCQSAPHGPSLGFRELACDDPEVEHMALLAVEHLNQRLLWGFRHILNQIEKVKVWSRRPFGEVYELELDTLETTCHALDPTPLANCSVRLVVEHAVEGDCDFHVLKQDGQYTVTHAQCHSTPDSAEDVRSICPRCPLLAPRNDTSVMHTAEVALAAFNAQNNGTYYKLVEISRAQRVSVPVSTLVEFAIVATDCTAKAVTDPGKCNLLAEKQYGFCKARLVHKLGGEEVDVSCKLFQTQPQSASASTAATDTVVDHAAPAAPAAATDTVVDHAPPAAPAANTVVAPVPRGPPLHGAHFDLRHVFSPVASVESASGEAFKLHQPAQPSVPGAAGAAVVRLCPGRVRYFKI
ncbi:alpha-2-HS-glycoprotein isoform X2 [Nannospalax galili]|uniref:alpha-2-HS-glycoprotein isoform X2 n=1 Tax=Nannospalax galili TaxID=1026970 RepID=UPI0004ED38D5|nr:alpha-2-HS-glycoprotein isoform X2 [Nannospalax galili]